MKQSRLKDGTEIVETTHPFDGLANGDERLAKVKLASQINNQVDVRGMKQKEAATLLGITQPEISNLKKGKLSGFSFDRLYRCLNALNLDVEIQVRDIPKRSKKTAGIHVSI